MLDLDWELSQKIILAREQWRRMFLVCSCLRLRRMAQSALGDEGASCRSSSYVGYTVVGQITEIGNTSSLFWTTGELRSSFWIFRLIKLGDFFCCSRYIS